MSDWLYWVDHVMAMDVILHNGKIADTYNIGGFNEWKNIDDMRYAIDSTKLQRELGWEPSLHLKRV